MTARGSSDVLGRRVAPGQAVSGEFTYSVVELPSGIAGHAERRSAKRRRTRLRDGVISERQHRALTDCSIKELSDGGARLQLDGDRILPRAFLLTDGATRSVYRAVLVWQDGREAGVKLTALD